MPQDLLGMDAVKAAVLEQFKATAKAGKLKASEQSLL
jgi:hypothetical protein